MTKLALDEDIAALYAPSARGVEVIDVPALNFVMLNGTLETGKKISNSESFQNALNVLNSISFTLKFISKLNRDNPIDFNTMPLEACWKPTSDEPDYTDRGGWSWTLMMMQPEHITEKMVHNAIDSLRKQRGDIPLLKSARLESFQEGLALQIMHVSSPGLIPMTIDDRIKTFAEKEGYTLKMPYHEVYISDPRHNKPEKQRTILRFPVRK